VSRIIDFIGLFALFLKLKDRDGAKRGFPSAFSNQPDRFQSPHRFRWWNRSGFHGLIFVLAKVPSLSSYQNSTVSLYAPHQHDKHKRKYLAVYNPPPIGLRARLGMMLNARPVISQIVKEIGKKAFK
jgi:hypothetical protein